MKKNLIIIILLTIILLPISAQKEKDALYLKNGSIIYGKLIEIIGNQYKIETSDGSLFVYPDTDIEKFAKETPLFDGRKRDGFGFGLEAGFLAGAQNSDYDAPFSFNIFACYTVKTRSILSAGSGVEFIGVPFVPLFIEYRYLIKNKKTVPFLFARGGVLLHAGSDEEINTDYYYNKNNFKGGLSCTLGTGVSWTNNDVEPYLSFAYRYAATSYEQINYNNYSATYKNNYNRLEVKLGFRF